MDFQASTPTHGENPTSLRSAAYGSSARLRRGEGSNLTAIRHHRGDLLLTVPHEYQGCQGDASGVSGSAWQSGEQVAERCYHGGADQKYCCFGAVPELSITYNTYMDH